MNDFKEILIKKIVLETLLESIEDTSNYFPDKWQDDFKDTIERKLQIIKNKYDF